MSVYVYVCMCVYMCVYVCICMYSFFCDLRVGVYLYDFFFIPVNVYACARLFFSDL